MTKSQFLQSLETELKSRRLPDAGEILEEYEQHFTFKLADGYTEQEIARKLGSPFEIAAQFGSQSPKREAPGGRSAIIAGLCLASVPTAGFFLLLAGWGIIVACFSLVSLAVAACLLGGISPWGLIPAMPGGIAAVYGIAMAALSILSASGCVYFAALFRQLVLACARCFKNAGFNRSAPAAPAGCSPLLSQDKTGPAPDGAPFAVRIRRFYRAGHGPFHDGIRQSGLLACLGLV